MPRRHRLRSPHAVQAFRFRASSSAPSVGQEATSFQGQCVDPVRRCRAHDAGLGGVAPTGCWKDRFVPAAVALASLVLAGCAMHGRVAVNPGSRIIVKSAYVVLQGVRPEEMDAQALHICRLHPATFDPLRHRDNPVLEWICSCTSMICSALFCPRTSAYAWTKFYGYGYPLSQ